MKMWICLLVMASAVGAGTLVTGFWSDDGPPPSSNVLIVSGIGKNLENGIVNSPAAALRSGGSPSPNITMTSDAEAIRAEFESQDIDENWAPEARHRLTTAFHSNEGVSVGAIDCRSTTCEVTGVMRGLTSANVDSALEKIDGPDLSSRLSEAGFEGQKSAEFTVLSVEPLSLSFRRIIKDVRR